MSNRCRIDAKSTPEERRARRIRGWVPGGPVPNKPLTNLSLKPVNWQQTCMRADPWILEAAAEGGIARRAAHCPAFQGGSGTEPEPETGTVGTVSHETESGTGTAGTVSQKPKPEPSLPAKLY